MLNDALLTGQDDSLLAAVPNTPHKLHQEALNPFLALREEAKKHDFDLAIVSSHRGFATQLKIWNEKVTGKRALLDAHSQVLDVKTLAPKQIVLAILRWSALPGASRHHWGTDFDVIDAAQMKDGYTVQLTPEEAGPKGPFGKMHAWLDANLADFNFFRPYDLDRGGVSPERWHLSYGPTATTFQKALTLSVLEHALSSAQMELKDYVLSHLEELYDRYVVNVADFT